MACHTADSNAARARQKALLPSRGRSASYASSRREYADERQAMLQQAAARRASRRRILHVPTAAAQDHPADGPAHRQSVRRYGAHIACCAARATANASPHMERRSTIRRDRKKWSNTLVWFCKCGRLNLHTRPFNAVAVEPAARCVCAPARSPALEHFSVDWPKERARRQYGDRCGRSRSPSQSNGGDPAAIPNTLSREATQGKSLKNALIRARHDGYSTE